METTQSTLFSEFMNCRKMTRAICEPLVLEDYGVQTSPDVSPPKWHLAHTTWFFERFVLRPFFKEYQQFDPLYDYLFNSYYETVGPYWPKERRGLLSRPRLEEVLQYRRWVEDHVAELIEPSPSAFHRDSWERLRSVIVLGIQHEQQHQELLLMDIRHIFWTNPSRPVYRAGLPSEPPVPGGRTRVPERWFRVGAGIHEVGHRGDSFAFDNEGPAHPVYLGDFEIAACPVTNGEFLEFVEDGGYSRPELWLSEGWRWLRESGAFAPLYWERPAGEWRSFSFHGLRPLRSEEPVCHVNLFEADAFARWKGCRLPCEAEWEVAARQFSDRLPEARGFLESAALRPLPGGTFLGDVWEWTSSAYAPYPGYRPFDGDFAEYNGKFMCNQNVLKGGSFGTPRSHIRMSYRNFYPPCSRWQFSGLRLARTL